MATSKSQLLKGRRDGAISTLNVAIEVLNLAKEVSSITPAKAVFGTVSALLTMIKDYVANERDCVDLGLTCANVCQTLDRGLSGRRPDEVSQSVLEAIQQLTGIVAEIQRKIVKQGKRNAASKLFHSTNDKEKIAGWKQDLQMILQVFNTELLLDIHRSALAGQGNTRERGQPAASIPLGELPPPPPRACFGRDRLIEEVVGLAENITPIALVGAGGIGKTSIALTVLHHGRIKERFGENRRFIRCDQFPASRASLLSQLSRAIGAGVENPEDLVPLRPSLSSMEMLLIFDNAESILDPHGPNAREIYEVVEELSQFNNICLFITSRITIIPPDCKRLNIPTLSMEAAASAFRRICNKDDRPDLVNNILEQLDFHPLSITLLATVAHQNDWDNNRLAREWEQRQTDMLQTDHNKSLAAAIELSLASPMFQGLGPDARGLLGVVAFFPQGVDEGNLNWLFSTISNRATIFDKFCNLSLTYRSNGFFTMLAPLRDYLCPKDPKSSPILCATRDCYLTRLSMEIDPDDPTFGETRWIISEDLNAEHLLDVFTSIDPNSVDVWDACDGLLLHLYCHKKRRTTIGQKIERLPDDYPAKPRCLFHLSWIFNSVGNYAEQERLLIHALKLERDREDEVGVASALEELCGANRMQGRFKEGIQYARQGLEIYQRIGDTAGQALCLKSLAWLLYDDEQLDAAKEAVFQTINLLPKKGEEFQICQCHRLLGNIYHSQGEKEKAVHHFQVALGIASAFNWLPQLFWIHYSLANLFLDEEEFGEAHLHIDRAKTYTVDHTYDMARATELNVRIWRKQGRFGEAASGALRAIEIFEKLGSTRHAEDCRDLLRDIKQEIENQPAADVDGQDLDFGAHDALSDTFT